MQVDLNNFGIAAYVSAAACTVTAEELAALPGGAPNQFGEYHLTNQYLSDELKVMWALFQREYVQYKAAAQACEQLTAADVKIHARAAFLEAESMAKCTHQFFWTNLLFVHKTTCAGHSSVGFDDKFRLWVSVEVKRNINNLSFHYQPHQHYCW